MPRRRFEDNATLGLAPLDLVEVEALMANDGREFVKDSRRFATFLGRVHITMQTFDRFRADAARTIEELRMARAAGASPARRALDALSELSPEQEREILDLHLASRLAAADQAVADAQRAWAGATSEANRVRLVVGELLDDETVEHAARARFEQLLEQLPAAAPDLPEVDRRSLAATAPIAAPAIPAAAPPATVPAAATPVAPGLIFAAMEPDAANPSVQLQVFVGESCVASIDVDPVTFEASALAVDGPWQRRGIASLLLDEARRRYPALRVGALTEDGVAFLTAYHASRGWPPLGS